MESWFCYVVLCTFTLCKYAIRAFEEALGFVPIALADNNGLQPCIEHSLLEIPCHITSSFLGMCRNAEKNGSLQGIRVAKSTRLEEILPAWAAKIQCLHPSIKGAEDAFIWHPLQSGIYSAKFGYYSKAMQAISQESIISPEGFNWIKDVWEKIPLLIAVHIAAVNTFKEVVIAFRKMPCLPPSEISLNVLPWICRTNWTSRNTLIFEKRLISPEDTAINDIRLAK
ncbi:hypothetical protein F2Q69_00050764 [Brassica cretica]|uniref:Uncharacterized protein n=1 Tax=Brassica cretica TaxID=69181 RepID=A0A8S9PVX3_BRACR|nr:hypothetical protein F2Q69_00050764 [Brassica cretica]